LNHDFIQKLKSYEVFDKAFTEQEFLTYRYESTYEYFDHFWRKYELWLQKDKEKYNRKDNYYKGSNGKALEVIITFLITREKILIKYMDENIGIPYVKPDLILERKDKKLIFLSLKTSLRERWKQADWEAAKFKKKYPSDYCYLLSNNTNEIKNLKKKIKFLDLEEVFSTTKEDFARLFSILNN